ncbi:hypothetical protein NL676_000541 [Syzygium grande]|nr:hypothetical protein NL676_000541 [Syzygium grande]
MAPRSGVTNSFSESEKPCTAATSFQSLSSLIESPSHRDNAETSNFCERSQQTYQSSTKSCGSLLRYSVSSPNWYSPLFCRFHKNSQAPPRHHMAEFTTSSQTAAILTIAGH